MKRLDFCKMEIKKNLNQERPINVIYQELNNMLPTYKEKKALQEFLSEMKCSKS